METSLSWLRQINRPPLWVSLLVAVGTVLAFVLLIPFGMAPLSDVFVGGLYLLLAVLTSSSA